MKIRNCMALICAVVALSACGRTVIVREGNSSEGTSSAVIEPVAVGKKTAKEKINLRGFHMTRSDMVKVFLWTKRTGRLVRLILMHNTASLTQRL